MKVDKPAKRTARVANAVKPYRQSIRQSKKPKCELGAPSLFFQTTQHAKPRPAKQHEKSEGSNGAGADTSCTNTRNTTQMNIIEPAYEPTHHPELSKN